MIKNNLVEKEMTARPGTCGAPKIVTILDSEILKEKGRLFGKITLLPGEKIGAHLHEGEWEAFYAVSGSGTVTIDGEEETLSAGSLSFTPSGSTHSIACAGDEPLVMMALILNK